MVEIIFIWIRIILIRIRIIFIWIRILLVHGNSINFMPPCMEFQDKCKIKNGCLVKLFLFHKKITILFMKNNNICTVYGTSWIWTNKHSGYPGRHSSFSCYAESQCSQNQDLSQIIIFGFLDLVASICTVCTVHKDYNLFSVIY